MPDDSGLHKLHPDDRQFIMEGVRNELRGLFEASARPPASLPPNRPPTDLDGFDAKSYARLRKDMLSDISQAVRKETADFLPEHVIDARIESVTKTIDERLKQFENDFLTKVRQAVADENTKLRTELFDIFEDLGMSLEKGDKRRATRDRLGDLWRMQSGSQEFRSEFWKQARAAIVVWLLGGVTAVAGYLGLRGGGSH